MNVYPGSKRLLLTLQHKYYHPELHSCVYKYICTDWQKHKLDGRGYGLFFLPERDIRSEPFEEVAIDLIGHWKINVRGKTY